MHPLPTPTLPSVISWLTTQSEDLECLNKILSLLFFLVCFIWAVQRVKHHFNLYSISQWASWGDKVDCLCTAIELGFPGFWCLTSWATQLADWKPWSHGCCFSARTIEKYRIHIKQIWRNSWDSSTPYSNNVTLNERSHTVKGGTSLELNDKPK